MTRTAQTKLNDANNEREIAIAARLGVEVHELRRLAHEIGQRDLGCHRRDSRISAAAARLGRGV